MGKIVIKSNSLCCAHFFETAFGARETLKGLGSVKFIQAQQHAGGNCSKSVFNIKAAKQIEFERFAVKGVFHSVSQRYNIIGKDIGIAAAGRKGYGVFVVLDGAGMFAVIIDNQTVLDMSSESREIFDQLFYAGVIMRDVVDNTDIGVIFFNRPIAFIGFDNTDGSLVGKIIGQTGTVLIIAQDTAVYDAGFLSQLVEDIADHGRGGGFAGSAADSNAVFITRQQLGQ